MKEIKDTDVWGLYQKCKSHRARTGLFDETERCHAFYIGDQWRGLDVSGESLPVMNIIKPTVDHKAATVAQNRLSIALNPLTVGDDYDSAQEICSLLSEHMASLWESGGMDDKCWQVVREAAITGDAYMLFYDAKCSSQLIDRTAIFFANEQESDIQSQKYILIASRSFADDVRDAAARNGVDPMLIRPDRDDDVELGEEDENDERVTTVLAMWRGDDGFIHKCRACRFTVYEPESVITGLSRYPLASFIWNRKKGSARGVGEALPLIVNQIEINRQMARMIIASKISAYPRAVYRAGALRSPDDLEKVGAPLEIDAESAQAIGDMVTYLQPRTMSPDAMNLWSIFMNKTKDLAGSSDAMLGQIDPTKASGTAIIAVKSQAALPLSAQQSAYRQFVEDIARIWWELWRVYNPDGVETVTGDPPIKKRILPQDLDAMQVRIRIDVSPDSPFDRYAQEQSIEKALAAGYISFEEYVKALDGLSSAPKGRFERILSERSMKALQAPSTDNAQL